VAATSILVSLASCSPGESAAQQHAPPPAAVDVSVVELREVAPSDELSGRLAAIKSVDLRPRVAGYVTAVNYREGSEVAAGAPLFAIDPRPYRAAFARSAAELARAKARVELTKNEAARAEKLLAANAIPKAERDALASASTQAEAEVQAAAAALELTRLDLEFTQVRAPFAGKAGRANVVLGDYVAAGPTTTLTNLVSLDPIYVYFTGDEQTYLRYVSRAEKSTIKVGLADETGYPHDGVVDFVDSRVDPTTGTVLVRAVLPNPDKRLVPGLFARVRIPEGAAIKTMLVDDKAILTDQDRKYVYVLEGDTVARRDIKLGRVLEGMRIVTDGLKPGDKVITTNIQKIFPGAKATVAVAQVKP
jgi:multidrug efflux system membrane fusion protein